MAVWRQVFHRSFRFYLIAIAALTLGAAIVLSPWIDAVPVPVELRLDAPANTPLRISWGPGERDSLPMVLYANSDGISTNLWLAELPPRPSYHLAVTFETPVKRAALRQITLIDVRRTNVPIYEKNSEVSSQWFEAQGLNVTYRNQLFILRSAASGGRIVIPDAIKIARHGMIVSVLALWAFLFAILLMAIAMIWPLIKLKGAAPESGVLTPACEADSATRPLWIAFGIATTIHVLLVAGAPMVLAAGDTMGYMVKGVALAQHWNYGQPGYEYELNRLPGYPLILAGIFKLFGYHVSSIGWVQALLYCAAVMALAMSLRKWIRPWIGAAAVFLAILSPAQVWASRTVLSESTFGTFSLFAMAAFFNHLRARGLKSFAWMILFALLATFAVFIRPNGIALYLAFLPVYIPRLLKIVTGGRPIRERLAHAVRFSLPYFATVIILAASLIVWSARNYRRRGYFVPTDMTGVTLVCGLMASGTFDVDCLANTQLYNQYLMHKYESGYYYPGYSLRHDLYLDVSQNGTKLDKTTLARIDQTLKTFSASSKRSSLRLDAIGLLRSAWWAITWPDIRAFSRETIRLDYVTFANNDAAAPDNSHPTLQYIRETYLPYISNQLIYDQRSPNLLYSLFSHFADLYYEGWYIAWSMLGLAAAVYILWRGQLGLAAPAFVFIGNIALNVYLLNVFSRYIHILDALIMFQCAMGISLYLNQRAARKFRKD